eukprot:GHVS01028929.1.p1 GENE.GHVS01028929.1~~GHVS01028929.1.p1  ORF type:complete len:129 (+),score=0.35 GHVS01028929.1:356-742(+)
MYIILMSNIYYMFLVIRFIRTGCCSTYFLVGFLFSVGRYIGVVRLHMFVCTCAHICVHAHLHVMCILCLCACYVHIMLMCMFMCIFKVRLCACDHIHGYASVRVGAVPLARLTVRKKGYGCLCARAHV